MRAILWPEICADRIVLNQTVYYFCSIEMGLEFWNDVVKHQRRVTPNEVNSKIIGAICNDKLTRARP